MNALMRGTVAGFAAMAIAGAPLAARADWHGGGGWHGGGWHGGGWHGGGWRGGYYYGPGAVVAGTLLGLGAGAVIAGAVAPPPVYYSPPPPVYYAPPPTYYPGYAPSYPAAPPAPYYP
jgi:hypothetical protein